MYLEQYFLLSGKKEVLKGNKLSYHINHRIIDYARNIEGIEVHVTD